VRRQTARRIEGFSLLELIVVVVLVSVLLSVAIERLLVLQARAEHAAAGQVLDSLRSGLTIRVAELIAKGRVGEVSALAGSNPMDRLSERPANYLGELFGPDAAELRAGYWYFDSRDRLLVYLVDNAEYFRSALSAPARARFAVVPDFDDANGNGRFDPGVDAIRGIRLVPKEAYDWRVRVVWGDWPWQGRKSASAGPPG
jgi:prepilin-type N-terminal cleavage/methylation domain-containing protein